MPLAFFRAEGHEVDRANIVECHVRGCGECMACRKGKVELCAVEDDAAQADLVLATADASRCENLVRATIGERKRLYQPYLDARRRIESD